MAVDGSIWRWALTDDLETLFARLIAADDRGFLQIAREVEEAYDANGPSLEEMAALSEAKYRAKGLPDEILQTMLTGLRSMVAEASAARDLERAEDTQPVQGGRVTIALASSQMFHDGPHAILSHETRAAQAAALLKRYAEAASANLGFPGQTMAQFLDLPEAKLREDEAFDWLVEAGVADVVCLWPLGDQVYALTQWQEDQDQPIDIEFFRAPRDLLDALKRRF